jgi:hypothetical protein
MVACMVCGVRPDHNSICQFRRRYAQQLPGLLVQTVALCQQAGLVSLGDVAVHGTKLRANRSAEALSKVKEHFKGMLEEAEQEETRPGRRLQACAARAAGAHAEMARPATGGPPWRLT